MPVLFIHTSTSTTTINSTTASSLAAQQNEKQQPPPSPQSNWIWANQKKKNEKINSNKEHRTRNLLTSIAIQNSDIKYSICVCILHGSIVKKELLLVPLKNNIFALKTFFVKLNSAFFNLPHVRNKTRQDIQTIHTKHYN